MQPAYDALCSYRMLESNTTAMRRVYPRYICCLTWGFEPREMTKSHALCVGTWVLLYSAGPTLHCVCVCDLPIYFGDSPTDQSKTCTSLCSVFRGLHFAAYFSVLLNLPRVTQEGVNIGAFFFFFFDAPPTPAVLAFIFIAKGSAFPFPHFLDAGDGKPRNGPSLLRRNLRIPRGGHGDRVEYGKGSAGVGDAGSLWPAHPKGF